MGTKTEIGAMAAAAEAEEAELVERAQSGDLAAFEAIVSRFEGRIYRLARHITGNEADAEDVLQETFMKVHAKLGQFQQHSRLYTWVVRIAVNQALMKLRRRRKQVVSLDQALAPEQGQLPREIADWHPNPEQQYQTSELGEILNRALLALALPYRVVFQLRDIEELSSQETAEALGISVAAVKSRLLRARLQLRARLSRHFRLQGA
ncbi:MAG: sigma-70 family RNA polymerase sigma factor [Terriglobales bacterium]